MPRYGNFAATSDNVGLVWGQQNNIAAKYLLPVVLSAVFALSACGDKPSTSDCEKLLDHLITIEVSAAGTDQLTPEMEADLVKQKKVLREHLKKQFMDQCKKKTPGTYVRCGLKARNLDELAKCESK